MNKNEIRLKVLLGLFEMAGGNPLQGVESDRLCKQLDMDYEVFSQAAHYLREEGLINYRTFSSITISHEGVKAVEKIKAEKYQQTKERVLAAILDMDRMSSIIIFADLAHRLGMSDRELAPYCNGLHEEGLILFPGGDVIQITDAGKRAFNKKVPISPDSSTTNIMNINQNYGAAAIGFHINQTVNVNTDFDKAINGLLKIVQSSNLDDDDKEELSEKIVKVNQLALQDTAIEKVNRRLDYIKTTLQGANLLVIATPYLEAIWNYFKVKYNL